MSGTRHISTLLLGLVLIALQAFGSSGGGQASPSSDLKVLDAIDSDSQVEPSGEEKSDSTVAAEALRFHPRLTIHAAGLLPEHVRPFALVHGTSGSPRAPPPRRS